MIGVSNIQMRPNMKGHMYKTYIRPVLMYGLVNCFLNKTLLNEIKRFEGNIIKKLLGVPRRCRTTAIVLALNLLPTKLYLENQKTELYTRLISNQYTRDLIVELAKHLNNRDFIN